MHQVKLIEPPRRRMRVHELAGHVGATPMTLLRELQTSGEWVASVSTKVEEPTIRKVCMQFNCALPWESGNGETTRDPDPQPVRAAMRPALTRQPGSHVARTNNPLMDVGLSVEDLTRSNATIPEATPGGRRPVPPPIPPGEAAPAWAYGQWLLVGFTDEQRDHWIAAGLRPSQARCARELADGGIDPIELAETVGGHTLLARVLNGEGGSGVARMYRVERDSRRESA